jgi:hypothetical protein
VSDTCHIRRRHDTDAYNYIELCDFLKLLALSACQCLCHLVSVFISVLHRFVDRFLVVKEVASCMFIFVYGCLCITVTLYHFMLTLFMISRYVPLFSQISYMSLIDFPKCIHTSMNLAILCKDYWMWTLLKEIF